MPKLAIFLAIIGLVGCTNPKNINQTSAHEECFKNLSPHEVVTPTNETMEHLELQIDKLNLNL